MDVPSLTIVLKMFIGISDASFASAETAPL
jgi:hypothetical protein